MGLLTWEMSSAGVDLGGLWLDEIAEDLIKSSEVVDSAPPNV